MAADALAELHQVEVSRHPAQPNLPLTGRAWTATWPPLAAILVAVAIWQLVTAGGLVEHSLPGPLPVLARLFADLRQPSFGVGLLITVRRALLGYAMAVAVGAVAGILLARLGVLRRAVGPTLTGLQSMPTVVWLPLALILLRGTEPAVTLIVVLGAAPAIALGLLSGVDQVPPLFVRVGRVMGARGFSLYRRVVLPAALPAFVAGLKQGWALAWRSLMSAELIVAVTHLPSIGERLQLARQASDTTQLLALMIVILAIGAVVDFAFGLADRRLRLAWGLAS